MISKIIAVRVLENREVSMFWNSNLCQFLSEILTWKTSKWDLSDSTWKSGHYHMEKSLDLITWLSKQGRILNKDVMARSKINISLFFEQGGVERIFFHVNLNLCLCISLTTVNLNVYLRQLWKLWYSLVLRHLDKLYIFTSTLVFKVH